MTTIRIGALRWDLIAETESFEKSVTASKKEMRDAKRIAESTLGPTEKVNKRLAELDNLRKKGLITHQQYIRAVEQETRALRLQEAEQQKAEALRRKETLAIKAQTQALREQQTIRGQLRATGQHVGSGISAGVGRAGGGMVAGVLGFLGVQSITEEIRSLNELGRASRMLGIGANELQAYRMAALQFAGVSSDQLDEALKEMNVRLADARKGTGAAKDILDEYGLSAERLIRGGTGQAFRELTGLIRSLADESERMFVAEELFGGEAAPLANLFKQGPEALDEMRKKVRDLGLEVDQNLLKSSKETADAWNETLVSLKVIRREIVSQINPALKGIARVAEQGGRLSSFQQRGGLFGMLFRDLRSGHTMRAQMGFNNPEAAAYLTPTHHLAEAERRRQAGIAANAPMSPNLTGFHGEFVPDLGLQAGLTSFRDLMTNSPLVRDANAAAERRQNAITQQQQQVNMLRARLADVDQSRRENAARRLGSVPDAGGRGSVAEYQALRQMVVGRQQARFAAEQAQRDQSAETTRQAIVTAIQEQTGVLREMETENSELSGVSPTAG